MDRAAKSRVDVPNQGLSHTVYHVGLMVAISSKDQRKILYANKSAPVKEVTYTCMLVTYYECSILLLQLIINFYFSVRKYNHIIFVFKIQTWNLNLNICVILAYRYSKKNYYIIYFYHSWTVSPICLQCFNFTVVAIDIPILEC